MTAQPGFLIERPARQPRLLHSPKRNTGRPDEPPSAATRDAAPAQSNEPALGDFSGVDALSEVLRAVRLRGAIFFVVDATAPWVAEAPSGRELTPLIMPGAQHLLEYHIVTRGSCWGGLVGAPPVQLHAGDVGHETEDLLVAALVEFAFPYPHIAVEIDTLHLLHS